jgi:hypothetical protein
MAGLTADEGEWGAREGTIEGRLPFGVWSR